MEDIRLRGLVREDANDREKSRRLSLGLRGLPLLLQGKRSKTRLLFCLF